MLDEEYSLEKMIEVFMEHHRICKKNTEDRIKTLKKEYPDISEKALHGEGVRGFALNLALASMCKEILELKEERKRNFELLREFRKAIE